MLTDLSDFALLAFQCLRRDGDSNAELSLMVAYSVGKQARRAGLEEKDIGEWLKGAYGAVWVRQTGLNPGVDLREVRKMVMKAYRALEDRHGR